MISEQFQRILAIIKQQAAERAVKNPYFTFTYNWGIINSSDRVITAAEVMHCINVVGFPPIGKN